jgi:hypothetical protein
MSAEGEWTHDQKRQHLRYHLCWKLKAAGMDPAELAPLIMAVVREVTK